MLNNQRIVLKSSRNHDTTEALFPVTLRSHPSDVITDSDDHWTRILLPVPLLLGASLSFHWRGVNLRFCPFSGYESEAMGLSHVLRVFGVMLSSGRPIGSYEQLRSLEYFSMILFLHLVAEELALFETTSWCLLCTLEWVFWLERSWHLGRFYLRWLKCNISRYYMFPVERGCFQLVASIVAAALRTCT